MGSSRATEKGPDHINLQGGHDHNHGQFRDREPKDPGFGRQDCGKVPGLSGLLVFLHPINSTQLARQSEQGFVHGLCLGLGSRALLLLIGLGGTFLVLDRDLEIDHLLCKSRHVVGEAKRVFTDFIRSKDVVALTLLLEVKESFLVRALNLDINVE